MNKAEASVETMEGIQETMHSAEEAEIGAEGSQCTPSKLEDMEVEEGMVENTLALV